MAEKCYQIPSTPAIHTIEPSLFSASKGCCHRTNVTGRFLGVVGFLFGNPKRLFYYQDFGV